MYTVVIFSIIGFLVSIYTVIKDDFYKQYGYDSFFIFNHFFGLLIGASIGVAISIALPMDTYINIHSYKIEALQDNNSVNSSFFLGSGIIEGRMKYVFYIEENGEYRLNQIDYKDASIKYSDTVQLLEYKVCASKALINKFAIDRDLGDKYYVIEVPKGTIKNNYNLDAQ